ncbi:MAG: hypothetical protein QOG68_1959 [Solirubrobacteraceae bacterium]|nr:hypothetical protein [Solirubrobacteraceae bacterium]
MNSALAVKGDYVYVGSRSDGTKANAGVMVVNVHDPASPSIVGQIGQPNESNPGESSRELRILPDKNLLLVLNHGCSELIHACANATQAGENIATSNVRFYDISGANAAAPQLVSTYIPTRSEPQTPHEFFLWTDPKDPQRVLMYETTPSTEASGKPQLTVVDISHAREGRFTEIATWKNRIGDPSADTRLHSLTVSDDGRRAYLAYLGGGFMVADTSDFADNVPNPQMTLITATADRVHWGDPGAHSAIQIPGKPNWVMTTDEVYGKLGGLLPAHGCPWGWPRFIDISDPAHPRIAAQYRLPWNEASVCASVDPVRENFASFSSHNPTLTRDLAIVTWHSGGLQAIDIADPSHPKPAAGFWPAPLPAVATEDPALTSGHDKVVMWSFPVIQNGLIYAIDLRNGLYILRYHGPHDEEVAGAHFLDGNSNSR